MRTGVRILEVLIFCAAISSSIHSGFAQDKIVEAGKGQFKEVNLVNDELAVILRELDLKQGALEFDLTNNSQQPVTALRVTVETHFEDGRYISESLVDDYLDGADLEPPSPLPVLHNHPGPLWPGQSQRHRRALGASKLAERSSVTIVVEAVIFQSHETVGTPDGIAYLQDRRRGILKVYEAWLPKLKTALSASNSTIEANAAVQALEKEFAGTKSNYGALNQAEAAGRGAALAGLQYYFKGAKAQVARRDALEVLNWLTEKVERHKELCQESLLHR